MVIEGVDFSSSRPSPLNLRAAGKSFVGRYFGPGGSWKHATRAEVAGYLAVGIAVTVLAEGATTDPLKGITMGAAHARSAHDAMVAAGIGSDTPIYFAVDFDMQDSQWSAVKAYLDGCASVIGRSRVGVYGGKRVIQLAAQQDKANWFWQTYAWSGGFWSAASILQQYRNGVTVAGGDVDLDRALSASYGQWPPGPASAPGAPPAVPPVTTATGWDYNTSLARLAEDWPTWAATADNGARSTDQLRNL